VVLIILILEASLCQIDYRSMIHLPGTNISAALSLECATVVSYIYSQFATMLTFLHIVH